MPIWLARLLGPEVYWLAMYLIARWVGARNVPATPAGNTLIENFWWGYAFAAPAGSFLLFVVPGPNRWILLLRLGIAAFIGLNAGTMHLAERLDYPEPGRNSGTYGYWLMGTLGGTALYVVGAICAAVTMWQTRSR
ncbi:MAG: hypothetical protein K2Q23_10460 [Bryobacteraceae bacterium]|nr:hypothetical protein [Bryobacteraceae bacterium]